MPFSLLTSAAERMRSRLVAESVSGSKPMPTQFASQGAEPKASTPEALARHMQIEMAKWREVAHAAGVKIQ